MENTMQKLNTMGETTPKDTNQVVEVEFPDGKHTYSYVGSGNLRTGQQVSNAPITHYLSGKDMTCKKPVKVVATHNLVGAQVGDKTGVENGRVKTIPTGLKYLPGAREISQNRDIDIRGQKMKVNDYMQQFDGTKMQRLNAMGETIKGVN